MPHLMQRCSGRGSRRTCGMSTAYWATPPPPHASSVSTCQGVIDSYGFGMAKAQPLDRVCGEVNGFSKAVACLLLEWAELGDVTASSVLGGLA